MSKQQTTAIIKKNRSGRKRLLIIGGVIIALIVVLLMLFGPKKTNADDEAVQTTTAAASVMTIENPLESEGEVTSSLEEDLSPHTSYYLDEVKVEAGDALEEGDTILTYTNGGTMKAPYNCVVESWSLPDEEEKLTADHSVTVAGTDMLQMNLSVSEDQISLVEAGDEATVTVDAVDGSFDGVVTSVSEVGEYSSSGSTFTAKVTFENDGSVKLGMSGAASIILEKAEDALCIPVNAITTSGGESKVTVQKDDGTTEEITVTTGIKNDAYIQITDGLSEGDTVVVPVSDDDSSSGGFPGMPGSDMPGGGEMPDFPSGGSDGGFSPPGQ